LVPDIEFAWIDVFKCAAQRLTVCSVYSDNANRDPDHQAKLYDGIDNSPIAKQMDSLIRQIDSAESSIPSDLHGSVLVVETFDNYSDFLKRWEHKFRTPQDTKAEIRKFKNIKRKRLPY